MIKLTDYWSCNTTQLIVQDIRINVRYKGEDSCFGGIEKIKTEQMQTLNACYECK